MKKQRFDYKRPFSHLLFCSVIIIHYKRAIDILAVNVQNTNVKSQLTSRLWHFGAKVTYKVTTIVMERIASHEILIKERL